MPATPQPARQEIVLLLILAMSGHQARNSVSKMYGIRVAEHETVRKNHGNLPQHQSKTNISVLLSIDVRDRVVFDRDRARTSNLLQPCGAEGKQRCALAASSARGYLRRTLSSLWANCSSRNNLQILIPFSSISTIFVPNLVSSTCTTSSLHSRYCFGKSSHLKSRTCPTGISRLLIIRMPLSLMSTIRQGNHKESPELSAPLWVTGTRISARKSLLLMENYRLFNCLEHRGKHFPCQRTKKAPFNVNARHVNPSPDSARPAPRSGHCIPGFPPCRFGTAPCPKHGGYNN